MSFRTEPNVVRISFSPQDLLNEDVKLILVNRELLKYGGGNLKHIDIPCTELYSACAYPDEV